MDASFAVTWFVPERSDDLHERLLMSDQRLLSPDLILLEVSSALTRKERRGDVPVGTAAVVLGRLRAMPLTLAGFDGLLEPAIALSLRLRHGLQDCLYLALAQREGAQLATFDARQAAHATTLAIPLWTPESA